MLSFYDISIRKWRKSVYDPIASLQAPIRIPSTEQFPASSHKTGLDRTRPVLGPFRCCQIDRLSHDRICMSAGIWVASP